MSPVIERVSIKVAVDEAECSSPGGQVGPACEPPDDSEALEHKHSPSVVSLVELERREEIVAEDYERGDGDEEGVAIATEEPGALFCR